MAIPTSALSAIGSGLDPEDFTPPLIPGSPDAKLLQDPDRVLPGTVGPATEPIAYSPVPIDYPYSPGWFDAQAKKSNVLHQVLASLSPEQSAATAGAAALTPTAPDADTAVPFQVPLPQPRPRDIDTPPTFAPDFGFQAFKDRARPLPEINQDLRHQSASRQLGFADQVRASKPQTQPPFRPQEIADRPQTPDTVMRGTMKAFLNPLMLLAGAAGALTKRPALNAINAAAGVLEGMNMRDTERTRLNHEKFRRSVKETATQAALDNADLGAIINNPNLSNEEKLGQARVLADQINDPLMKQFANDPQNGLAALQQRYEAHKAILGDLHEKRRGHDRAAQSIGESGLKDEAEDILEYRANPPPASSKRYPQVMDQVRKLARERGVQYDVSKSPAYTRGGRGGASDPEVQKIKQGIETGRLPPSLVGLGPRKAGVEAALEDDKFDLSQATTEWAASRKQLATLNSDRMIRAVQASRSVINTIEEAKRLTKEMDLGGIAVLNKAQLKTYTDLEGNSPNGRLARRYLDTINTVKEEFTTLINSGYAPTSSVWDLANNQIRAEDGAAQMIDALDQVQKLIDYRMNAIPGIHTMGPEAPNRYVPGRGGAETTPPASATTSGQTQLRPPTASERKEFEDGLRARLPRDKMIDIMRQKGIDTTGL